MTTHGCGHIALAPRQIVQDRCAACRVAARPRRKPIQIRRPYAARKHETKVAYRVLFNDGIDGTRRVTIVFAHSANEARHMVGGAYEHTRATLVES